MRTQNLKKPLNAQFFTEREAWNVFRAAAFAEAFGWTLLISGILIVRYLTPGNRDAVLIAGQIHGTIFLAYLAAVAATCGSLHWPRKLTLLAGLVSIPPYGTLVFELWLARRRREEALSAHRQIVVRGIILDRGKLLAYQPKEGVFWCLPGGALGPDETPEQALERAVRDQTGVKPSIEQLDYVFAYRHRSTPRLEFFFSISNGPAFRSIDLQRTRRGRIEIDEIAFIDPRQTTDLRPTFLQTAALTGRRPTGPVRFISEP